MAGPYHHLISPDTGSVLCGSFSPSGWWLVVDVASWGFFFSFLGFLAFGGGVIVALLWWDRVQRRREHDTQTQPEPAGSGEAGDWEAWETEIQQHSDHP